MTINTFVTSITTPKLSGTPGCNFVAILKIGMAKKANTNNKAIKTKPMIEKNRAHVAISRKKVFEALLSVNCSN